MNQKVSGFSAFRRATVLVLRRRVYLYSFALFSSLITALYFVLLPSLPNGSLNLNVVQFITPLQVVFAVIFGVMLGLIITFNVAALHMNAEGTKTVMFGSVLSSLVNGLCCTPVIPSLIAFFGASSAVAFRYSPPIQAFFEFNYPYFYLLSVVILAYSLLRLSKNMVCC
jgi:hypothetical protein